MKSAKALMTAVLLIAASFALEAQDYENVRIDVQKLSDRVIVLTEDSSMKNNIIALATQKGLVVVDTGSSCITGAAMRKRIVKEFGRDDFIYAIDTHYHWDHARGNQVFADIPIIAHENAVASMRIDVENTPGRIEHRQNYLEGEKQRLAALDPESEEARDFRWRLEFSIRNFISDRDGLELTLPNIVFSDRMTLDLGDMTLNLIFFGRAHSGSDILIHVPEEGILLTGDLFLDRGWKPLFAGMRKLDVPRFIEVLGQVLDADDSVRLVIPGHKEIWPREKLVLWRDYIVGLWDCVNACAAENHDAQAVAERFPLAKAYYYMEELGHTTAEIDDYHARNIQAFFRQTQESAADKLLAVLDEHGLEEAKKLGEQLFGQRGRGILFNEYDFNVLGYNLMNGGRIEAAVYVFDLNVRAFPESWNVYDSLGEALLNSGRTEEAVKNYKKSIELNPDNQNGKAVLQRISQSF